MPYEYKREPLTSDELSRLETSCTTARERLVIYTLLDTGLRVSEFCQVTKDMIDWQRQCINVSAEIAKRKKRRVVPLTTRTLALLQAHFALQDSIGMCRRTAWNTVVNVANKAAITKECGPHVLRHTFAVRALQKGVSVVALQKVLGHSDLRTTMVYLNMSAEDALREFREKT